MADTNAHRIWTTAGGFGVWGDTRSPRGGVSPLGHEGTLSAGRRIEKKGEAEQSYSPLMMLVVVIEQWICMVLGITCIVSGILGISMHLGQDALPADLSWSKSIYVPLLRITAAVCLAWGAVLVRLGWRGTTAPADSSCTQRDKEEPYEKRR
jgi:hypothetical protein